MPPPAYVDEQWVKDLQIFKNNTIDPALIDEIMKENEITTEVLLDKLDGVKNLTKGISTLHTNLHV